MQKLLLKQLEESYYNIIEYIQISTLLFVHIRILRFHKINYYKMYYLS